MMRRLSLELAVVAGYAGLGFLDGVFLVLAPAAFTLGAILGAMPPDVRARLPWGLLAGAWAMGAVVWAVAYAPATVAVLGVLLVGLQLHRRATRRQPLDDRVALVLAGLMLVAAAGGTQAPGFVGPAVAFGIALPLALLPARSTGGGGWLPLHAVLTAALFVLLPRPAPRPVEPPDVRLTGFAPDIALGALDPLLDDPGRVLTAALPDTAEVPERLLWRGLALDGFDGTRWYSSTPPQAATLVGEEGVAFEVEVEQGADGVLFAPGRVTGLSLPAVRADGQGGWFAAEGQAPPARYTVHVVPLAEGAAWFHEGGSDRSRWLALPPLDPAVGDLARSVAGQGSPRERVERLAAWLETEVEYTREGQGEDAPLERFLLDTRRGHCEYVAAGLAVLARSVGVPSRVVTGFASREVDPVTGRRVVRRQHAHAWTEVLLDDDWVVMDATPAAAVPPPRPTLERVGEGLASWWRQQVVGFDRADQRQAVYASARRVEAWLRLPGWADVPWRGLLVLLGLLALGAVALRLLGRWVRRAEVGRALPKGPVARQHARARQALSEAGLTVPAALPPIEAVAWLEGRAPGPVVEALGELAWLYYAVALGGRDDAEAAAEARRLADRVVEGLRDSATGVR